MNRLGRLARTIITLVVATLLVLAVLIIPSCNRPHPRRPIPNHQPSTHPTPTALQTSLGVRVDHTTLPRRR